MSPSADALTERPGATIVTRDRRLGRALAQHYLWLLDSEFA